MFIPRRVRIPRSELRNHIGLGSVEEDLSMVDPSRAPIVKDIRRAAETKDPAKLLNKVIEHKDELSDDLKLYYVDKIAKLLAASRLNALIDAVKEYLLFPGKETVEGIKDAYNDLATFLPEEKMEAIKRSIRDHIEDAEFVKKVKKEMMEEYFSNLGSTDEYDEEELEKGLERFMNLLDNLQMDPKKANPDQIERLLKQAGLI